MNMSDIATWGQLISSAAVLVTLVYLAIEILSDSVIFNSALVEEDILSIIKWRRDGLKSATCGPFGKRENWDLNVPFPDVSLTPSHHSAGPGRFSTTFQALYTPPAPLTSARHARRDQKVPTTQLQSEHGAN